MKLIKRMLLFKDGILTDHRPINSDDVTEEWIEMDVDTDLYPLNECIYNRCLELNDGKLNRLPNNPNPSPIPEDKILLHALKKLLKKEDLDQAKAELESERNAR